VDFGKEVTVRGTVTSYNWGNPHVMFGMDVQTANGSVEKWNVGGPSTNRMAANGWEKATLKPGDVVTAMGYQFTDGQKILRLQEIVMANGKKMFLYGR
jgi:tRNA A37 N6-isopentenylltransferase MiaA